MRSTGGICASCAVILNASDIVTLHHTSVQHNGVRQIAAESICYQPVCSRLLRRTFGYSPSNVGSLFTPVVLVMVLSQ